MNEIKLKLFEMKIKKLEETSAKHEEAIKTLLSIIEILSNPVKK